MPDRKIIKRTIAITMTVDATWPDHYGNDTLSEAIKYEEGKERDEIIADAIEHLTFVNPDPESGVFVSHTVRCTDA